MQIINVLLVDDHELVRTGIASLLNADASISVKGIANCGEQALVLTEQLSPDVILMDVNMPGIGGVEACRRILEAHPTIKILVLSAFNDISIVDQMLKQGAMGFISKEAYQDVKAFFHARPVPGAERTMKQSLEVIAANHRWAERDRDDICAWLNKTMAFS